MTRLPLLASALLATGLAACTAPPAIHYHTLLAPVADAPRAGTATAPFLIDVLPVGVPPQLDQAQWVVRQGTSGIAVLDGERWASPLGDEMRNALSAALAQQLGTRDIAGLARPAGQPVLRLKLQLRRLDAWPGQRVQLDADWSLGFADDARQARLVCRTRLDEPAPGDYAALAQAQQRMVAALAAEMAARARSWAQGARGDCV